MKSNRNAWFLAVLLVAVAVGSLVIDQIGEEQDHPVHRRAQPNSVISISGITIDQARPFVESRLGSPVSRFKEEVIYRRGEHLVSVVYRNDSVVAVKGVFLEIDGYQELRYQDSPEAVKHVLGQPGSEEELIWLYPSRRCGMYFTHEHQYFDKDGTHNTAYTPEVRVRRFVLGDAEELKSMPRHFWR